MTSKSVSQTFFALDALIMSPVRPKIGPLILVDVKALNIPRQRDVKLNDLAKQILMLLPLLLLLLLLLYVLYHVLIRGREAPPYNYVISTYSRSSSRTRVRKKCCPLKNFWKCQKIRTQEIQQIVTI